MKLNLAAQSLGRLGGLAKSEAKTAAARANAKKGGWPKGKKRKKKWDTEPCGSGAVNNRRK